VPKLDDWHFGHSQLAGSKQPGMAREYIVIGTY
jgi:hypothetical protein